MKYLFLGGLSTVCSYQDETVFDPTEKSQHLDSVFLAHCLTCISWPPAVSQHKFGFHSFLEMNLATDFFETIITHTANRVPSQPGSDVQ